MSWPGTMAGRGIYKRIGYAILLILIVAAIVWGSYAAWYRISDQESKSNKSKFENEVRRIERNARVGYHFRSDPEDTFPLAVLRFIFPEYDKFNDGYVIKAFREKFYPDIPRRILVFGCANLTDRKRSIHT